MHDADVKKRAQHRDAHSTTISTSLLFSLKQNPLLRENINLGKKGENIGGKIIPFGVVGEDDLGEVSFGLF